MPLFSKSKECSLGIVLPPGDAQSNRIEPLNEFNNMYSSLIKANSDTEFAKNKVIQ